MEEKQIDKWLRRQFSPLGWALVGYYVLMNLLSSAAIVLDLAGQYIRGFQMGNFFPEVNMDAVYSNAWGYIATIAVGLVILYAWKGWDFFRWEVLAKEKAMSAPVFFCLLAMCVGSQMVNSLWIGLIEVILNLFGISALGILEAVSGSTESFSMFLYATILAPFAEELIFRGVILRSLRPYGKRFAIVGSAVLFGVFHGNLLQTPYAFLVGLVLGYVTVEYSIGWAVALHLFNNLVLADLLSRLTANLPVLAANAISVIIMGGCAAAAAVILLVKRQQIAEYNRSEWIDRRCLKWFFLNSGMIVLALIMFVNMLLMLSV